jgi:adenylate kinase family enzyme
MVRDRISEADAESGFMLDGYPRTAAQVDYLDLILAESDRKLDVVPGLTADNEELIARLLGRAKETGALTTTKPSSVTAWTSTTSRPKPLSHGMPSAAS